MPEIYRFWFFLEKNQKFITLVDGNTFNGSENLLVTIGDHF